MEIKIESFDSFNKKQKRPDRKRHMELCGFENCWSDIIPENGKKPKDMALIVAKRYAEKHEFSFVHLIYFLGGKNMDGKRGYQFWVKGC